MQKTTLDPQPRLCFECCSRCVRKFTKHGFSILWDGPFKPGLQISADFGRRILLDQKRGRGVLTNEEKVFIIFCPTGSRSRMLKRYCAFASLPFHRPTKMSGSARTHTGIFRQPAGMQKAPRVLSVQLQLVSDWQG